MMRHLIRSLFTNIFHVGLTNRERTVTVLPMEMCELCVFRLDPFRRTGLEFLNNILERVVLRKQKQNGHLVVGATHNDRRAIPVSQDSTQVRVRLWPNVVREKGLSVLRIEDPMDEVLSQGLWHGVWLLLLRPFRAARWVGRFLTPQGVALG